MKRETQNARRACGVLICFAVAEEATPFLKTTASKRAKILITGMGGKNAERAFRKFLETNSPETVLSCGFAGGLNPELASGDIVFSADDRFQFKSGLLACGARRAIFHCAKRVAISTMEKAALRSQTGADAVEMESEIIRHICAEQKIPSATVRVISDAAHEDLPLDFNKLMTSDCKLSLPKIILAVLLKPWKIPALIRLGKTSKAAAENLSRLLESLRI